MKYFEMLTEEEKQEVRMLSRRVSDWVDKCLRHTHAKPNEYLMHFLSVGREYAHVTHDDSWGEFEKQFAIIVRNMVVYERILDMVFGKMRVNGSKEIF